MCLIAEIVILGGRDGFFPLSGVDLKQSFEGLKTGAEPDLILTHRRDDRHQDHRFVSDLTWQTFRSSMILEYEIPKYDGDLGNPNVFVEIPESLVRRKIEILETTFPSQLDRHWYDAETFRSILRHPGHRIAHGIRLRRGFRGSQGRPLTGSCRPTASYIWAPSRCDAQSAQERRHDLAIEDRTSARTGPSSNLRAMSIGGGMRWAVSAGWLVIALLLERILTLGGITDVTEVSENPPEFVATGIGLIVVAVAIAILVAADVRRWPSLSIAASAGYFVVGIWLRLEENDDSGLAIAIMALLIATLAGGDPWRPTARRDAVGSAAEPMSVGPLRSAT